MDTEFHVAGLAELQARLEELPVNIEKNIARGMIRAAAKIVADDARARAPQLASPDARRVPGALAVSVRIMSTVARSGLIKGGVVAGSNKKTFKTLADAFYAYFIEYGTAKMAARPFMRPAALGKTPVVIDAAAEYVRRRLDAGEIIR